MDYSFKGGLPPPQKADLLLMDSQYFPMGFNFMAEGKKRVKIGDRKKRNRSMKLASYHFLPE